MYPDGLTATLVKVEKLPNSWAGYTNADGQVAPLPASQTLVRATVELTNSAAAPLPIDSSSLLLSLYAGPERYEAEQDAGYSGTEDTAKKLTSQNPQRVVPGRKVVIFTSWDVPNERLNQLAVKVNPRPSYYTDYTFADAQILLK